MVVKSDVNIPELIDLARDKSEASRSTLIATIGELYADPERKLTEQDRAIMAEILGQLIREVEISVRQALANRFAALPNAPQELIVALAYDEIVVAQPVLEKSEVLRDAELLEIIEYRAMEHQLAIAVRKHVSEAVSDALVNTDNEVVVTKLLKNQGAQISSSTMNHLVAQSHNVPSYQMPLAERNDLSPGLAKKLFHTVSDAVRSHIIERFDVDPEDMDNIVEATVEDVAAEGARATAADDTGRRREVGKATTGHALVTLLRQGDIARFLNAFARLAGLPVQQTRRVLFETGGESLAITCKAVGLDKADFVPIFLWFRQGRLGDKQVEQSELSRALHCFESTSPETAAETLQAWKSGEINNLSNQ